MKQLTLSIVLLVSSITTTNLLATQIESTRIKNNNSTMEKADETQQKQFNNIVEKKVWLSIGSDAWNRINKNKSLSLNLKLPENQLLQAMQTSQAKVVSLPESQIASLSEYMHEEFNRCGGFVFHESMDEAFSYTQRSEILNSSSPQNLNTPVDQLAVNYTIDNPDAVNSLLSSLSSANLLSTVSSLSNYHNRYYTQQSGVDSANWIKTAWQDLSKNRSDISIELFSHSWNQPSVIATIQGALLPDEIVIIGGHLDSINSSSPSNGRAPGSDDNASGIAVITEALRVMVESGYKPARTIKIMGYAAEEVGLRGSKAIAEQFSNNSQNVVGVVQFDMTGHQGSAGKDIVFMTDYTSSAQNNFMMQLIDTYLNDIVYATSACGYGCSDHASWHNQGYPASMPFESLMGDSNNRIHTSGDDLFDSNHAFNFSRLAVTYLAELAKSDDWVIPPDNSKLVNGETIANLSASQGSSLSYSMEVPAGATNIKFVITGGSGDADLYVKFGTLPTDSSYDCRPYKNGNSETCNMSASGGTYYVAIKAYSTFSNLSLTGSFTEPGNTPPPIDETISDISLAKGEWLYQSVDLSAGYGNLIVTMSGGSGDADLYLLQGAQPTSSNYDCRPYKWGNEESCTQASPAAVTWYIGVFGYSASSGVSLNIKATP
jgi:bacterial leucyl aminopeptidase